MKLSQISIHTRDSWQCPCCASWIPMPRQNRRRACIAHLRAEHAEAYDAHRKGLPTP